MGVGYVAHGIMMAELSRAAASGDCKVMSTVSTVMSTVSTVMSTVSTVECSDEYSVECSDGYGDSDEYSDEYGGMGMGYLEQVIVMEELSRASGSGHRQVLSTVRTGMNTVSTVMSTVRTVE